MSTPTTSLLLQEINTGDQSGTWGISVNTNMQLIDDSIAGVANITFNGSNNYTLSVINYATDESRKMVIIANGTPGSFNQIVAPLVSKFYVVVNRTNTTITIGASSGTTVSIPYTATPSAMIVYCDGTDFKPASNSASGTFTANIFSGAGTGLTGTAASLTAGIATNVANGATGSLLYQTAASTTSALSIGTAGQVLTVNSGGTAPQWSTLSGVAVTTFSGGTTGLTPSSATSGAITLAGTLGVSNGGSGLYTTPTNGQIDIGNGTGFTRTTLTAGTGISVTNASGSITIANTGGTVTSVTGTAPVSVATGTTTPVISLASAYGDTQNPYASKTANFFLAAPNGLAGVPTFRAIVAADIPTLNQNTTGTAANITATSNSTLTTLSALSLPGSQVSGNISGNAANVTGIVGTGNGGTGVTGTPSNGQLLIGNGSGYSLSTLTAGSNVTITNSSGSITIDSTGGGGGSPGGSNGQVQYNNSGSFGGAANLFITSLGNLYTNTDITVNTLTLGLGANSVYTNTALGKDCLLANTIRKASKIPPLSHGI